MQSTPLTYPIQCTTRAENWVRDTIDYTMVSADTVKVADLTLKLGEPQIREDAPFRFEFINVFRVENDGSLVEDEELAISRLVDMRASEARQAAEPYEITMHDGDLVRSATNPVEALVKIIAMIH